jgi:hypothetical protein
VAKKVTSDACQYHPNRGGKGSPEGPKQRSRPSAYQARWNWKQNVTREKCHDCDAR